MADLVHCVLASVLCIKGTTSENTDGVSTYLALTFGTLLSSQGTDASFKTLSPVSPGASFFVVKLIRPFPARFPAVPAPFPARSDE
jgi:hypothetical protein